MKKQLSILIALVVINCFAFGQTFESGGIRYRVTSAESHTVEVTQNMSYVGIVNIAGAVIYAENSYTVTAIGVDAFYNCGGLTKAIIPSSVSSIKNTAFASCSGLKEVVILGNAQPTITSTSFSGVDNSVPIYVSCGTGEYYRNAEFWSQRNIQESKAELITLRSNDDVMGYGTVVEAPCESNNAVIKAIPTADYRFVQWQDGNTDNPRTITVTQNVTYTAEFTLNGSILDINNIKAVIDSKNVQFKGEIARKFIYPKDSTTSTIFANALWIGGLDENNQLKLAGERYNQIGYDFQTGPLDNNASIDEETVGNWNRVWKLSGREIQDFIALSNSGTIDENAVPEVIKTWPAHGDVSKGQLQNIAPFFDKDGNGIYEWRKGDYPLIKGDQCIFYVLNDAREHTESEGDQIGLEIHAMAYAFGNEANPAFWNSIFFNYKIHNRSATTLHDTYIGNWCDFDIGYSQDDYIGCDVERGLFYAYNALERDGTGQSLAYGDRVPAQGVVILGGTLLDADGEDNPKIDVDKMRLSGDPDIMTKLETAVEEGGYAILDESGNVIEIDVIKLTEDADLYKDYWYYQNDQIGSNAINGAGFGDGIPDNERMGMTQFVYHNNDNSVTGDPNRSFEYYNLMQGRWKDYTKMHYGGNGHFSNGGDGPECNYMFPGNSDRWNCGTLGVSVEGIIDDPRGWTEESVGNAPYDRRGMGASGPFTFQAGSSFEFDIAFVAAFGTENTIASGVEQMKNYTDIIRKEFLFNPERFNNSINIKERQKDKVKVTVFPNPTTGELRIESGEWKGENGKLKAENVEVFDMMGRKQYAEIRENGGGVRLNISHLPAGIYLVKAEGRVWKVVKN